LAERKLFGTDGVRGAVGELLTPDLAVRLGRAAALTAEPERPQVLIVRDTRESGPMLEDALAAGIASGGGDAMLGGVLPTPAASVLGRRLDFDLAAVVSASHNPFGDNGIKFFDRRGRKLGDEAEAAIEAELDRPARSDVGAVRVLEGAFDDYQRELRTAFALDLSGIRVALDCANGATHRAAPAIFETLGAEVELTGDEPDGRNINDGCGSTHPQRIRDLVASSGAQIGFAFDGDGDRVVAVDSAARLHDGDDLIALIATDLRDRGELEGGVAVTVMTNYGFHTAMKEAGIELEVTQVGDRYVIEAMEEHGWQLGGEQSGHIVWIGFAPTGDGIAASLLTLRALRGRTLEDATPLERLPQRLENVEVAEREAIAGAEALWAAVDEESAKLDGRGRVLVRPSGTEPLLRVMVEAPEKDECDAVVERLVEIARSELA
jgi:phosphoglucosamine mutase